MKTIVVLSLLLFAGCNRTISINANEYFIMRIGNEKMAVDCHYQEGNFVYLECGNVYPIRENDTLVVYPMSNTSNIRDTVFSTDFVYKNGIYIFETK
jgi:hypothetical protein